MKRIWIAYICLLGSLIHPLQIEAEEEFGTPLLPPKTKRAELTEGIWQDYVKTKPEGYVEVGDTIFIYDEEAFAWLSTVSNENQAAGRSIFEGKYIKLMSDLDLSSREYYPIGLRTNNLKFKGVFDGNNHVISGIVISDFVISTLKQRNSLSLFVCINEGEIKDLYLKNHFVQGFYSAAGLITMNQGVIKNCHVEGIVRSFSSIYYPSVAGLVLSNRGLVDECSVKGYVYCFNSVNLGVNGAGGICASNEGRLIKCVNFAEINSHCRSAGIAIGGSGYIVNCANYGRCIDDLNGYTNAGIYGASSSYSCKIYNSYTTGKCHWSLSSSVSLSVTPPIQQILNCYGADGKALLKAGRNIELQNLFWNKSKFIKPSVEIDNYSSFIHSENVCELQNKVYANLNENGDSIFTNDLVEALNGWVDRNQGRYFYLASSGDSIVDTVHFSHWQPDFFLQNRGYPIIEDIKHLYPKSKIVTKDTTITICAGVEYGDRVYTNEDHETVQQLRVGDVIYQKAKLLVKSPSFDKIGFNGPKFLCKGQTFDFNAHGGESYQWVVNDRVHSNSSYCGINPSIYPCALIELEVMKDGCPHTIYDTIPVEVDTFLVEMKGWGDVIAINNKDSLCVAYQWYRDGELLKGEVGQYYYEAGGLTPGKYTAKIFLSDSTLINTCPLQIDGLEKTKSTEVSLRSYPIPARSGETLSVEVQNVDDFSSGSLFIYDEKGRLFYTENKVRKINNFKLPEGCFIVVFKQGELETRGHKIIVKK